VALPRSCLAIDAAAHTPREIPSTGVTFPRLAGEPSDVHRLTSRQGEQRLGPATVYSASPPRGEARAGRGDPG